MTDDLVPAIIQDADTGTVLMLGYMNAEALERTRATGLVTFFSRSRQRLWTKGETSGATLAVVTIMEDCDADTLLIQARPNGPTCHTGTTSCFGEPAVRGFLYRLSAIIGERSRSAEPSYTATLLVGPMARLAQKVGEEGVEVALAAMQDDDTAVVDEAADLVYHLSVLLHRRGRTVADVEAVLAARHHRRTAAD